MLFLRNLYWQALSNPRYGWMIALGSLLYILSPLDILPDIFPLAGQLDDILLLSFLVSGVMQNVSKIFPPKSDRSEQEVGPKEQPRTIDVDATTIN